MSETRFSFSRRVTTAPASRGAARAGTTLLAKEIKGARTVEPGAGDTRQVENIGDYVGDVGVADRLFPAIAGAASARVAKAGVEAVEAASGGNAR